MKDYTKNSLAVSPTQSSERIEGLDVLRGFALYGVFLTNAFISSRPMGEAMRRPPADSSELIGPWWSETLAWGFFDGFLVMKFVTLFSLLFGMGLVLQNQRAAAAGIPFRKIYLRRLGLLAGIGIFHGFFLFEGDILLVYAFVGGLLFLFRNQSPRNLVWIAMIPLTIGFLLTLMWASIGVEMFEGGDTDGFGTAATTARRTGSLSQVIAQRPFEYIGWLVISSFISFNWRVVALFFLGAAIMKKGLLQARHMALHRRLSWIGLGVGGGLELFGIAVSLFIDSPSIPWQVATSLGEEIGSLLLSMGYAGTILWAVHGGYFRRLQHGLAAIGRTALTNYLLQSIAMNLIFMAFGLGLYEKLSRAEVLVWISLVFAAQVFASQLWMNRFSMGPCEWLWRRLTYPGPLPLRRKAG